MLWGLLASYSKNDIYIPKIYSGSFSVGDSLVSINVAGRTITFSSLKKDTKKKQKSTISDNNVKLLSANRVLNGPYYFTNQSVKKPYSKRKVFIKKSKVPNHNIATGVYVCDIYLFQNSIDLSEEVFAAKVLIPDNPAYSVYETQHKGVNWNIITYEDNSLTLHINYYTIHIKYNIVGQFINKVIPLDGRTVRVPYYTVTL